MGKQQQYYFKAKYIHKGEDNQSQLSFNKDNIILYHSCNVNNDAWLLGSLYCYNNNNDINNKLGWFPSTYVTPITLNEASYSITTTNNNNKNLNVVVNNYKQEEEEEEKKK